jgi:copper chaperone NosL
MYKLITILSILVLSACEKNIPVEIPQAHSLTREANGYYCLMTVVYHKGPKGQIILNDSKVLWFTSVRDTIAFTLSPEEPKNIAVVYVNDMSNSAWDNPGADNWIEAKNAWYVLGSNRVGGMDAPETVPFGSKKSAADFATKYGGKVYIFSEIPKQYITGS